MSSNLIGCFACGDFDHNFINCPNSEAKNAFLKKKKKIFKKRPTLNAYLNNREHSFDDRFGCQNDNRFDNHFAGPQPHFNGPMYSSFHDRPFSKFKK